MSTAETPEVAPPRRLVPEVIQTSGMDCGPACLNAFLSGFGVHTSYGRLREACQTDVDGTSIDTLEVVANQLGVDGQQRIVPVDHVLETSFDMLPAIVVVRLPNGLTHFVVAWGRHFGGRMVQVMDPGTGRRWPSARAFLDELYIHTQTVPAAGFREWAGTEEFLAPLRQRLDRLGVGTDEAASLTENACADPTWTSLGALDAACRMTEALIRSGAVSRGASAVRLLRTSYEKARDGSLDRLPAAYWTVRPAGLRGVSEEELDEAPKTPPSEAEELDFRGAVLIQGRGRRPAETIRAERENLSPDLQAALDEPPANPAAELFRMLREDGLMAPFALAAIFGLVATGVMTEMLLFRGLLDLGAQLATAPQRLGLMAALILFIIASRGLHYLSQVDVLGVGRRLEVRLRKAFLEKIPRLNDRYFGSRPVSDMAERAHSLHQMRQLSELGSRFFQYFFETVLTAVGMIWIHPARADLVLVACTFALGIPLAARPTLGELNLRMRTHLGALMKFYLDALLGLVAVRVHAAERTLRREQEELLKEWAASHLQFSRIFISVEGVQIAVVMACVIGTVLDYVASGAQLGGLLLLAYWGVNLPFRGRMIIYAAIDYVKLRNVLLRMLEPLTVPEEDRPEISTQELDQERDGGCAIELNDVTVRAGGHTILQGTNVRIEAGEHVAVVGSSGAGKTTLVSLLLGWHRPAEGQVLVDGGVLDDYRLELLRRETAWLDPSVQIWNRSLLENLRYGNASEQISWSRVVEEAELRGVLEKLPDGFQTPLGEGGGLVSGGEGQRVRLGRAMARPGVRLAILDEPFRGLGRGQRQSLLQRSRQRWQDITMICVTHDVAETRSFPRVLVVEGGRIVEDAPPAELERRPDSRYSELLAAEERVHALWRTDAWRQIWLEDGKIHDRTATGDAAALGAGGRHG